MAKKEKRPGEKVKAAIKGVKGAKAKREKGGAAEEAKTVKTSTDPLAPANDHLRGVWLTAEVTAYYPERKPPAGCVCRTTPALPGRTAGTCEHYRFPESALPTAVALRWATRKEEPWRGELVRFHYDGWDATGRMLAADVEPVNKNDAAEIEANAPPVGQPVDPATAEPAEAETPVKRPKIMSQSPSDAEPKAKAEEAGGESTRKSWKKIARRSGRFQEETVAQQRERLEDLRKTALSFGEGSEAALATLCACVAAPCLSADAPEDDASKGEFQESLRNELADIFSLNDASMFGGMSLFQEGLSHLQLLIENAEAESGAAVSKLSQGGKSWKQLKKAVAELSPKG